MADPTSDQATTEAKIPDEKDAPESESPNSRPTPPEPNLPPSSIGVYPVIEKAELAGGYFSKYVTFVIKTPAGDSIKRRYSDFEWLRAWFTKIFVGAFVPPIPPKLPVAMWPRGYLLMRKRELQAFLQRCYIIPYLKAEEVFEFFLTPTGDGRYDKACKKWDKTHVKPSVSLNILKIEQTFPEIARADIPTNLDEMCHASRDCVSEIVVCLDKCVQGCEKIITSQDVVSKCLLEFVGLTREMMNEEGALHRSENPEEQKFAETYINKTRLDCTHELLQWSESNKQTSQSIRLNVLPVLRKSLNDVRVMNDAIEIRDKLRSDYELAVTVAAKWKTDTAKNNLRANQVEQKHRDEQFEQESKRLAELVSKVVLSQLNLVWEANLRRWSNGNTNLSANVKRTLEQLRSAMADAATLWERDTSPRPNYLEDPSFDTAMSPSSRPAYESVDPPIPIATATEEESAPQPKVEDSSPPPPPSNNPFGMDEDEVVQPKKLEDTKEDGDVFAEKKLSSNPFDEDEEDVDDGSDAKNVDGSKNEEENAPLIFGDDDDVEDVSL